MPKVDFLLRKNRIGDFLQRNLGLQASMSIMGFVGKAINEKKQTLAKLGKKVDPEDKYGRGKDFLTRYIELAETNPAIPPW